MTDAVAVLRSRLETLAGRTVRTISPGDGTGNFPGAVEVVVDSTGAAFAPPKAAEPLSALLVQLQADYDDELTKTIDELLGSTFIEHLRDRLSEAETLRDDINEKLAQNPTAISGITLRLRRIPVPRSARRTTCWTRSNALRPAAEALPGPHPRFLSERITSAQETARARATRTGGQGWPRSSTTGAGSSCTWSTGRRGRSHGDRPGGGWRSLERGDHGLLSGGAKVVTLMQPFIAALHAMYDQAGIRSPHALAGRGIRWRGLERTRQACSVS